jgi:hypothetical protein
LSGKIYSRWLRTVQAVVCFQVSAADSGIGLRFNWCAGMVYDFAQFWVPAIVY